MGVNETVQLWAVEVQLLDREGRRRSAAQGDECRVTEALFGSGVVEMGASGVPGMWAKPLEPARWHTEASYLVGGRGSTFVDRGSNCFEGFATQVGRWARWAGNPGWPPTLRCLASSGKLQPGAGRPATARRMGTLPDWLYLRAPP